MYAVIESRGRFTVVPYEGTTEASVWGPFRTEEGAQNCRDRLERRSKEQRRRHFPFRFLGAVIAASWVGFVLGWGIHALRGWLQ